MEQRLVRAAVESQQSQQEMTLQSRTDYVHQDVGNGSIDSILYRALGGSTRLDTRQRKPMWISPMRAECNDGHKLPRWGTFKPSRPPQWRFDCKDSRAVAVTKNMVVVASKDRVIGLSLNDGKPLWSQPIPMPPVPWGIAVDRSGRVVVTLKDGQVICFGKGV